MIDFNIAIQNAELEYISDTVWNYRFENQFILVDFYKDETGKNHIEQFLKKVNGLWIEIMPTDEQIKAMFKKLNDIPYREEEIEEIGENLDYQTDPYYGVYGIL